MKKIIESLTPFLVLGFTIAIFFALLFFLFQILLWGSLIGLAAWGIALLKAKFFPNKARNIKKTTKGRIIEHDDF